MSERPKFEDYYKTYSTGIDAPGLKDAFMTGVDAFEPIIAELEKQLSEARAEIAELEVTQEKLANLLAKTVITGTEEKNGLEKQLAEARAEMEQRIAEAVLAESEWWYQGDYAEYSPKIARARIAANRAKAEGARKGETK